jgi:hypothetical protein
MAYYSRKFQLPFQEVMHKVTQNLQLQGFTSITQVDIHSTFKTKMHVDFRKYIILGAFNPQSAYKASWFVMWWFRSMKMARLKFPPSIRWRIWIKLSALPGL